MKTTLIPRATLTLAALVVLLALAPLASAGVDLGRLPVDETPTVCRRPVEQPDPPCGNENELACATWWYTGGATDFGVGFGACLDTGSTGQHQYACAETAAGMGTLGGFFGPYGESCAVAWGLGTKSPCAAVAGHYNGQAFQSTPLCA